MRRALLLSLSILALSFAAPATNTAWAQGCTGPDCAQQPSDGHQCEHEKKDEVTS